MKSLHFLFALMVLTLAGCDSAPEAVKLSGPTMGTRYHITYLTAQEPSTSLQQRIDARLHQLNQAMSTYQADSELSQFNSSSSLDCQPLSEDTFTVLQAAQQLSEQTGGSFDVTVGPLINLWGFNDELGQNQIPNDAALKRARTISGYQKLVLKPAEQCAQKTTAHLYVNLSAIAKGYAVDEIAGLLEQAGIENYLVEIGGETRTKGASAAGRPWRIAVESPDPNIRIQQIIEPGDNGVATSGNYRNYFEMDGVRYSHTIDPVSGRPVTHSLASVTVVHDSAMLADGWATALAVLGPKKGMALARQHRLAVYMLVEQEKGFEVKYSSEFEQFLLE